MSDNEKAVNELSMRMLQYIFNSVQSILEYLYVFTLLHRVGDIIIQTVFTSSEGSTWQLDRKYNILDAVLFA